MREHHERLHDARWLRPRSNTVKPIKPKSDSDLDAEVDKLDGLTWEVISTRAEAGYQIQYKLGILLDWMLADGLAAPRGVREMVQSIQADMWD